MGKFKAARTLAHYPQGSERWAMLGLTMLATVLASYEFTLAPLLPLLLPYLHMSRLAYGYFVSAAVFASGISAFFGGPLADRYGRVVIIDTCLFLTTVLTFFTVLVTGVWSFIFVRILMGLIAGLMAGAGAALARDMSPRLSRALAFGLLTIGPVGANFLSNFIAGMTLPIYHTWQSQIRIMGFLATLMYVPIVLFLKDLSPELRLQIFHSASAALYAQTPGRKPVEIPKSAREAFGGLLGHPEIWLMVMGVQAFLTVYVVIQAFGPLMFTEAFHYSSADAAAMNANFWLLNLALLIVTGIVSDRTQLRKPIAIAGAIATAALMAWWIPTFGMSLPRITMAIVAGTLGAFLAIAYLPWAALFSETLEEISPALQATGWAFFGLVARLWVAISAPLMLFVAARHGWATWMWVCLAGVICYIASLVLVRSAVTFPAEAGQTASA